MLMEIAGCSLILLFVCVIGWQGNLYPIISWHTNLRVFAVLFTMQIKYINKLRLEDLNDCGLQSQAK